MRKTFFTFIILALVVPTTPLRAQAITEYWLNAQKPCKVPFTFTLNNADQIREGTTFYSPQGLSFTKKNSMVYLETIQGYKVANTPAPVRGNIIKGTVAYTKSASDKPLIFYQEREIDRAFGVGEDAEKSAGMGFQVGIADILEGLERRWNELWNPPPPLPPTVPTPVAPGPSLCQKSTWDLGVLPPSTNQVKTRLELTRNSIPSELRDIMEDNRLSDEKTISGSAPTKDGKGIRIIVPYRTLAQSGGMEEKTATFALPPDIEARACERCFSEKVWPDIRDSLWKACPPITCSNQQNLCKPYASENESLEDKLHGNKAPEWMQCENFQPLKLESSYNYSQKQWQYFISFSSSCTSPAVTLGRGNCGGC